MLFVVYSVRGCTILEFLCEQESYTEYTVASLMEQFFLALDHIHSLEIAHLDIEVCIHGMSSYFFVFHCVCLTRNTFHVAI